MKIFWVVVVLVLAATVSADDDENIVEGELMEHYGPFLFFELIDDKGYDYNEDGNMKKDNDAEMNANENAAYSFDGEEIMSDVTADQEETEISANEGVHHEADITETIMQWEDDEGGIYEFVDEQNPQIPVNEEKKLEDNERGIYEFLFEQDIIIPLNEENLEKTEGNTGDVLLSHTNEAIEKTSNEIGGVDDEKSYVAPIPEDNEEVALPEEGFGTIANHSESSYSGPESTIQSSYDNHTPSPDAFLAMFNHLMHQAQEGQRSAGQTDDGFSGSYHAVSHEPHKPHHPHHHHHHSHHNENPEVTSI